MYRRGAAVGGAENLVIYGHVRRQNNGQRAALTGGRMGSGMMMVVLTGVIAVLTGANVLVAWWYAKSTKKILCASFIQVVCELYNVREVRRRTAMFKALLPREFSKVEEILRSGASPSAGDSEGSTGK
jgi:hypothetical protein